VRLEHVQEVQGRRLAPFDATQEAVQGGGARVEEILQNLALVVAPRLPRIALAEEKKAT